MKINTVLIAVLILIFTLPVYAKDVKDIRLNDLPDVVQVTVLKYVEESSITNIEKEINEGVVKYEIESTLNGFNKDITVSKNGEIIEIEEEVSLSKLSSDAQDGIKKDYPEITIKKIEAVQEYYFEVEGEVNGKLLEFKVFATGDIEDEGNIMDHDNE